MGPARHWHRAPTPARCRDPATYCCTLGRARGLCFEEGAAGGDAARQE